MKNLNIALLGFTFLTVTAIADTNSDNTVNPVAQVNANDNSENSMPANPEAMKKKVSSVSSNDATSLDGILSNLQTKGTHKDCRIDTSHVYETCFSINCKNANEVVVAANGACVWCAKLDCSWNVSN